MESRSHRMVVEFSGVTVSSDWTLLLSSTLKEYVGGEVSPSDVEE